ncbi:hypothetical protein ACGFNU_23510 [Spirillospora sp. NPDC048911]|uniref:hypothetical protein n=1 Tax=Spirillospora sp. NPDC048911 TaxID=3364527 RepID=UPI00371D2034
MTAVVLLGVLAAAVWVCASPVRLAVAGAVLMIAHPVPTFAVTAVATVALTMAAVWMAYRSLGEGGWWLITVQRPAFAVSRAGVAS